MWLILILLFTRVYTSKRWVRNRRISGCHQQYQRRTSPGWWLVVDNGRDEIIQIILQHTKTRNVNLDFRFLLGPLFCILGKNDVPNPSHSAAVTQLDPQFRWVGHESNNRRPSDFGSRFTLPDPPKRWVAR